MSSSRSGDEGHDDHDDLWGGAGDDSPVGGPGLNRFSGGEGGDVCAVGGPGSDLRNRGVAGLEPPTGVGRYGTPMLSRAALATYRRPTAWVPIAAVLAIAVYLAEVVEPWPEGGILLSVPGTTSHGLTFSDVVLMAVLVTSSVAWLCFVRVRDRVRSVVG